MKDEEMHARRRSSDPTTAEMVELVTFLPRLRAVQDAPIHSIGGGLDRRTGIRFLPWVNNHEVVREFQYAASKECWRMPNYTSIDVDNLLARSGGYGSLDLEDVKACLAWIVRGERFCEGAIAAQIASGHLLRVLERLGEIAGEIASLEAGVPAGS